MQMKIVVSANGVDLDAPASPVFGRCPVYVFVDTETMVFEAVENPAVGASGGAGIQAAQFVVERGAQAAVTGNMGPNAFSVLQSAGIPIYLFGGGTVRQAVEAFKAGQLQAAGGASAPAHAGMGMGRGMGRGMGMGRGVGRQAWGSAPQTPPQAAAAPPAPSRDEEIAALKDMAGDLRKQLADALDRLDRLEKGG
jgi:predicted Fe-Mo cluster-binding NifX family protein